MDYIKSLLVFIALFFTLTINCLSQNYLSYSKRQKLPELATKQSIDSLRFISYNGKFTYYQRRTGQLNLSTNYRVDPILKGIPGANYLIFSSAARKKVIIEEDQHFHSFYGVRKLKKIYVSNYGTKEIKELGLGINPKLHLVDRWVSYYHPQLKTIFFSNLDFSTFKFKIQIKSYKNPYFIPQVIMPSDGEVYYTDLNAQGTPIIKYFDRKTNSSKLVYTGSGHQFKFELCLNREYVILGEFNRYNNDPSLNMISVMKKDAVDFSKRKIIYESPNKDFGNMICNLNNEDIFFLKNFTKEKSKKLRIEVARLNIQTQKIKALSQVNFATQVINMDGRLILPYRGKFYLLLGENNLATIDELEAKQPDTKKEKK